MKKEENNFIDQEEKVLKPFYKKLVDGKWTYPLKQIYKIEQRDEVPVPENADVADIVEENPKVTNTTDTVEPIKIIAKDDNEVKFDSTKALLAAENSLAEPMTAYVDAVPRFANQVVEPVQLVNTLGRKEQRPNASVMARNFMNVVPIKIYNETIYVWIGSRYVLMTQLNFKRVLNSHFRNQAEAAGTAKFYDSIIDFLLCEDQLVVTDADRKVVENKIALNNGYIDISTMKVMPPNPGLFFMVYLNIDVQDIVDNATTPVFDRFLSAVTGGDTVLQARIMEMIGYCLSNDMNAKAFFLLQGVSNSGKSTLINLLASFFADDLLAAVPLEEIGAQFAACELFGKALNINGELGAGSIKAQNARQIKVLTGNDLVSADVKYKSRVRFRNTAKMIFATNNPLYLEVNDEALLQRIVVIPFAFAVPDESRNRNLMELLMAERGGIFLKAMGAYRGLVARNYRFSGNYQLNAVCQQNNRNIAADFVEVDWLKVFVEEKLIAAQDRGIFLSDVREAFEVWLHEKGCFGCKPLSDLEFGKAIRKHIPETAFTKKRKIASANPTSYIVGYKMKEV